MKGLGLTLAIVAAVALTAGATSSLAQSREQMTPRVYVRWDDMEVGP